jgi:2-haloalkanoic acid dehalogenase type II
MKTPSDAPTKVRAAHPRAVVFDLLTALLDSAALWDSVAGGAEQGRPWRAAYLRNTYAARVYRPYEQLVRQAACEVGLPEIVADRLVGRYRELAPWPEVNEVLGTLARHVPLAVVTNCSETLGQIAAARIGVAFGVVVTAERAGYYKPHPRPYSLALEALGEGPETVLFVAGSPYDLFGAAAIGMPVYWHNRLHMTAPPEAPAPLAHHDSLYPLLGMITAAI